MTALLIMFSILTQSPDTSMQNFLPPSFDKWHTAEPPRLYSGDQIFLYMDGAGEVYLAYKFRELLVQRYSSPNSAEILVEIFDMGLPGNAYGIYTYMQGRGPRVEIGQNGEYKSGLLCFWKGKYFVSIRTEKEEAGAESDVMNAGKYISGMIRESGDPPVLPGYIQEDMRIPGTLRYFYRYEILNNHLFLASDNILQLSDSTECVLVRLNEDRSYMLLVRYNDVKLANSAYENFIIHYMPDAQETGAIRTENKKWTICIRHDNFIAIVVDARTKPEGINSIDAIIRRLP